jgi:hypothetical protein
MSRLTPFLLSAAFLACAMACSPAISQTNEPQNLPLLKSWHGDYPVAALDQLPAGQRDARNGYLGSLQAFAAVWQTFKPDTPVPAIDFAQNLVMFTRNIKFFNRTSILKVTLTNGTAEILAIETMSAMPIEDKVAMSMVVVPRQGIEMVQVSADRQVRVE